MIIYNMRKNGPYEYDKFILNIGQIYNMVADETAKMKDHAAYKNLKVLDEIVKKMAAPDSISNKLLSLRMSRL